jgi:hypothetical protein
MSNIDEWSYLPHYQSPDKSENERDNVNHHPLVAKIKRVDVCSYLPNYQSPNKSGRDNVNYDHLAATKKKSKRPKNKFYNLS